MIKTGSTAEGRLPEITDPDTHRETPAEPPRPTSPAVARMSQEIADLKLNSELQQAKLDEKIAAAEAIQSSLSRLQRNLDDAVDALVIGDAQAEGHRASFENLRSRVLTVWGKDDSRRHSSTPSHLNQRLKVYTDLAAHQAATIDYDEPVRPSLVERVGKAQSALDDFEQANSL